jgi:type II secretory pathway pseudopilin PulG
MVDRIPTRAAVSRQSNTLPERLAILAIIAVMAAVVLSNYARKAYAAKIQQAKQSVIREDCKVIRQATNSYQQDKGHAPGTLDELVQSGYLVALPKGFHKGDCIW